VKNKYKIYYNGNGNDGGNPPTAVEYEYNANVIVEDKGTLFKTGYSFNGWNRAKAGGANNIAPNSTFSMQALNEHIICPVGKPKRNGINFNKKSDISNGRLNVQ
jgi:hypothetical protein